MSSRARTRQVLADALLLLLLLLMCRHTASCTKRYHCVPVPAAAA